VVDAQLVEAGFRIRLASFGDPQPREFPEAAQNPVEAQLARPNPDDTKPQAPLPKEPGIRRGRVSTKTIRLRDKDHRKFVSTQPCVVCGRSPADAHQLRFAQSRALGRKVSDELTVPVCRVDHRELHRHGDEAAWWKRIKIDPLPIAHRLWRHARLIGAAVNNKYMGLEKFYLCTGFSIARPSGNAPCGAILTPKASSTSLASSADRRFLAFKIARLQVRP
jgi:hypothetical protein